MTSIPHPHVQRQLGQVGVAHLMESAATGLAPLQQHWQADPLLL
jgi:hypothetical protein